MKTFLFTIFLFSSAIAGKAQVVQSSCDAPDSVKSLYRVDAAWLAYQYEKDTNSPYLDSIDIPLELQNNFMKVLLAVYNAKELAAVDSIIKYKFPRDYGENPSSLQSFHPFLLDKVAFFWFDTVAFQWQRRFVNHLKPTGNIPFDSLIEVHSIIFDSIYFNNAVWVAQANKFYNILVLDSLINVAINYSLIADRCGYAGNGDKISAEMQNDSSIKLTYSIGWDDCLSGCISRHFWRFTVFPDCSVRFDSSFGTPFSINSVNSINQNNDLNLYPNPASKKLSIETKLESSIEIFDVLGNTVRSIVTTEERTDINISNLPKGTYYVRATNKKGGRMTAKFIKE